MHDSHKGLHFSSNSTGLPSLGFSAWWLLNNPSVIPTITAFGLQHPKEASQFITILKTSSELKAGIEACPKAIHSICTNIHLAKSLIAIYDKHAKLITTVLQKTELSQAIHQTIWHQPDMVTSFLMHPPLAEAVLKCYLKAPDAAVQLLKQTHTDPAFSSVLSTTFRKNATLSQTALQDPNTGTLVLALLGQYPQLEKDFLTKMNSSSPLSTAIEAVFKSCPTLIQTLFKQPELAHTVLTTLSKGGKETQPFLEHLSQNPASATALETLIQKQPQLAKAAFTNTNFAPLLMSLIVAKPSLTQNILQFLTTQKTSAKVCTTALNSPFWKTLLTQPSTEFAEIEPNLKQAFSPQH